MKYIAMNRFEVIEGREDDFEKVWRERTSFLSEVPGFLEFHLLRGEEGVFLSHALWEDEESFRAWTESEAFKKAHGGGGSRGMVKGHPQFNGYRVVI